MNNAYLTCHSNLILIVALVVLYYYCSLSLEGFSDFNLSSRLDRSLTLTVVMSAENASLPVVRYRIVRDDFQEDSLTKMQFVHYDDAYDELEFFYADVCCSDERIEYSIVLI